MGGDDALGLAIKLRTVRVGRAVGFDGMFVGQRMTDDICIEPGAETGLIWNALPRHSPLIGIGVLATSVGLVGVIRVGPAN